MRITSCQSMNSICQLPISPIWRIPIKGYQLTYQTAEHLAELACSSHHFQHLGIYIYMIYDICIYYLCLTWFPNYFFAIDIAKTCQNNITIFRPHRPRRPRLDDGFPHRLGVLDRCQVGSAVHQDAAAQHAIHDVSPHSKFWKHVCFVFGKSNVRETNQVCGIDMIGYGLYIPVSDHFGGLYYIMNVWWLMGMLVEFWFKKWWVLDALNRGSCATRNREITPNILQGMDANGHEIINAKLQSMKIVRPPMNDEICYTTWNHLHCPIRRFWQFLIWGSNFRLLLMPHFPKKHLRNTRVVVVNLSPLFCAS